MMSKLIIEMEMPQQGCCDCMVELMGHCMIQDKDVPLRNENGDYPTELPKGCPIKGVLPDEHGDLIDRQDAIKEFEPYAEYESNRSNAEWVQRIKTLLNFMTPIIAAERKDDGNI
jgi:hypothetical protein